MYMRRDRRRQIMRTGWLLLAVVVLTPRFELPGTPSLMALFDTAANNGQPG
jgi:hypothetical protein